LTGVGWASWGSGATLPWVIQEYLPHELDRGFTGRFQCLPQSQLSSSIFLQKKI
jgi:hypothetical protein